MVQEYQQFMSLFESDRSLIGVFLKFDIAKLEPLFISEDVGVRLRFAHEYRKLVITFKMTCTSMILPS